MNTATNKIRFTVIGRQLLCYIPLPKNKAVVIYPIVKGAGNPISIRHRSWAIYDYADYSHRTQELLEALCNEEYLSDTLVNAVA